MKILGHKSWSSLPLALVVLLLLFLRKIFGNLLNNERKITVKAYKEK
jgi:hypothetical protein